MSIFAYAGIGDTDITKTEEDMIYSTASMLASEGFVCYSGNALGADITFQRGSGNRCVVMLPWRTYNLEHYIPPTALAAYCLGDHPDGLASLKKYHRNPDKLNTWGKRAMICRDHFQVHGYETWPRVKFVLCCATPLADGTVKGGTNQAVAIAKDLKIPVVNIRTAEWVTELANVVAPLIKQLRKQKDAPKVQ